MTLAVGVVGAGIMGADHARTLAGAISGATLAGIADPDAARAGQVAAGVDGCRAYADPVELIADVDAVVVASPDDTHEAYTLACLQAGRPVLCEKPLATTAEAALRLVRAEEATGRPLVQVGFMRRFDPGYRELKRLLDADELGGVLLVHCVHRNGSAPATFGAEQLLTSSATHEIDAARWLLGEEVTEVTVHQPRSSGEAPAGVGDPLFVVLRTASGALVDVEVFVNARYGYDVRCEVVGERGTASLVPPAPVAVRRDGAERLAIPADWRSRFAAAYRHELQTWVDGVLAGEVRGPTAWDGYVATAVAEAC